MKSFENAKVLPTAGAAVSFDIEKKGGEVHATNVQSTKRYTGKVKLIKENENYGFVICEVRATWSRCYTATQTASN